MTKKLMIIGFLAMALGATGFYFWQAKIKPSPEIANMPESLTNRVREAARLGGRWLLAYQGKFSDPGILWIIKKINDRYCHLPRIDRFLGDRFGEFENREFDAAYKRLFDESLNYQIDHEKLAARKFTFDDILIPVIYCDKYPVPPVTLARIFDVENARGYDLTHRFLAMDFLKERGCETGGYGLDEAVRLAAEKIAKEQSEAKSFDDLYAERVAFLYNAGLASRIQDKWIETILENQQADGGWKDPIHFGKITNPHTTAVSVWALSEYDQTCSFE